MTEITKLPTSPNQPPIQPEVLKSRRTRRVTAGLGLAMIALGGVAFAQIPFGSSRSSHEMPDFIIEGTVGSVTIQGAVNLECNEHPGQFAVVDEKLRIVTTRTDRKTNSPSIAMGRWFAGNIDTNSRSCADALAAIRRNPSRELQWALAEIDTRQAMNNDGTPEKGAKYAQIIEQYRSQVPVYPVVRK